MINRAISLFISFASWQPWTWITMLVAFGVSLLVIPIRGMYRAGSSRTDNRHRDVQRQFRKEKFAALVRSWLPDGTADPDAELVKRIRLYNAELLRGDYVFPVFYSFLLALLYAYLSFILNFGPSDGMLWVFAFPFIAALLDFVENSLHIIVLRGVRSVADLDELPGVLIAIAALAAWTKLILGGYVILQILFLLLLLPYR